MRSAIDKELAKARRSAKRTTSNVTKLVTQYKKAKAAEMLRQAQLEKQQAKFEAQQAKAQMLAQAQAIKAKATADKLEERKAKAQAMAERKAAREQAARDKKIARAFQVTRQLNKKYDALSDKLGDLIRFEEEGGRYDSLTRAKLKKLAKQVEERKVDPVALRKQIVEVGKVARKQRNEVIRQHKLVETRIAEAKEIREAGGQLSREYELRLAKIQQLHLENPNARYNDVIYRYLRNQRKGQVLRAQGAYIGQVKITKAISASGSVHIYDEKTDTFWEPKSGGTAISTLDDNATMVMETGFVIPIKYKQSEREAVATFINNKLKEMREKQKKGELVKTGQVLDNALITLAGFGVLEYDPAKGLKSLKFNPKKIDELVAQQKVPEATIDMVLYNLAGYERFSDQAKEAVAEQRLFNSYKFRGENYQKYLHGLIDDLLRSSGIWNKYHPYIKGASPKSSEEEQADMDEVIRKARSIESYFPPAFVKFTNDVIEANEVRGHTVLADLWVDILLFIYERTDLIDNGMLTMEDLDQAVKSMIPR